MTLTMSQAAVAVKSRKSAIFATEMLQPRSLVNHC